MYMYMCSVGFLIAVSLVNASIDTDPENALIQDIRRLEAKLGQIQEKHKTELESLKDGLESVTDTANLRDAELGKKVAELVKRVSDIEAQNNALVKRSRRCHEKMRSMSGGHWDRYKTGAWKRRSEHRRDRETDTREEERKPSRNLTMSVQQRQARHPRDHARSKRASSNGNAVAFSAYLDHNLDFLGMGDSLPFNKVITNIGNAYDNTTGVFTVPSSGVYVFTVFIGQRNVKQLWTGLHVNGQNVVDAVAQTDSMAEEVQGGNSVVLSLSVGDTVNVKNFVATQLQGTYSYRLNTFSGYLLYP